MLKFIVGNMNCDTLLSFELVFHSVRSGNGIPCCPLLCVGCHMHTG